MGYACPGAVGEWQYGVGQAGIDTGAAGRGGPQVVHFRVLELSRPRMDIQKARLAT